MTKIICTIGPQSKEKKVLYQLAQNGMTVARLNFSHGSHSQHREVIKNIKELNEKRGTNIKLLQDLEGFRIRVGKLFRNRPLKLKENQKIMLIPVSSDCKSADKAVIPFVYQEELSRIRPGFNIYLNDGNILLKAEACSQNQIKARAVIPGTVKSHMGINIPELNIDSDVLKEKDKKDILFGIKHKVDYMAQSFVRHQKDMILLREFTSQHNYNCKLIAKIENREGLNNLESILDESEGILIARGDLGVSIPIYEVPVMQKRIIRLCNQRQKIDITATQMLESMTQRLRPTRAEVSDVANAVLDGSDYVMLSGETAVGKHPVEAVKMMKKIIDFTLENSV